MQERQTKQKQMIYDALKTLNHPTATEVYGYVHGILPTVSRATVFRVLGGFAQSGKALELRLAGNEVRYDYNIMPHYHARCLQCGRVADVHTKGINEGGMVATNHEEFEVQGYTLEFFGTCKTCRGVSIS
jgi:Fe2+ or Zn2+ uptake regulation protein